MVCPTGFTETLLQAIPEGSRHPSQGHIVLAHCLPGHEPHVEARAELVEYLEAWRTGKVLSRYDLHSWWQGLAGPVTCISEPVGRVIIDRQILGHKPAPTPRMLGVAAVLDRYFSFTDSAPRSGDDIEAQLAQSNGDAAVSSMA